MSDCCCDMHKHDEECPCLERIRVLTAEIERLKDELIALNADYQYWHRIADERGGGRESGVNDGKRDDARTRTVVQVASQPKARNAVSRKVLSAANPAACPDPKSWKWGGHVGGCYGPQDPRHMGRPLPARKEAKA